jgi:hypothetical protein
LCFQMSKQNSKHTHIHWDPIKVCVFCDRLRTGVPVCPGEPRPWPRSWRSSTATKKPTRTVWIWRRGRKWRQRYVSSRGRGFWTDFCVCLRIRVHLKCKGLSLNFFPC